MSQLEGHSMPATLPATIIEVDNPLLVEEDSAIVRFRDSFKGV